MKKILFIHGINNEGFSSARIEDAWTRALKTGATAAGLSIPADVGFKAAFYGDRLAAELNTWSAEDFEAAGPMTYRSPASDYVSPQEAALYLEYMRHYKLKKADVAMALSDADNSLHWKFSFGFHKRWLKTILRTLEPLIPAGGRYVVAAFLKQANAYLHKPGLKEDIDTLVREQVFDDIKPDDTVVIVAHSLGSVIAYTVLRALKSKVRAARLVTAGSPLGVQVVKERIGPPLTCLPNVGQWVNAADPDDFVALRPRLTQTNFGCNKIVNLANLENGDQDPHSIVRYLAQGRVAEQILSPLM